MIIGGLQKTSVIDYPGKISCVVFTVGCNFRCPYCHNPQLIGDQPCYPLPAEQFFSFLEKRSSFLDGVVITGGEPTLHDDLASFCQAVKKMELVVKLDTNGSQPEVINNLVKKKLVDYLAMDIKTDPRQYAPTLTKQIDSETILTSIDLIKKAGLPYEFRTTCASPFVDKSIMALITDLVAGAPLYVLQQFRTNKVLAPEFFRNQPTIVETELEAFQAMVAPHVEKCIIR